MDYIDFIESKANAGSESGFRPVFMPDAAFDFQRSLIDRDDG